MQNNKKQIFHIYLQEIFFKLVDVLQDSLLIKLMFNDDTSIKYTNHKYRINLFFYSTQHVKPRNRQFL